jgi:hypothetical protein
MLHRSVAESALALSQAVHLLSRSYPVYPCGKEVRRGAVSAVSQDDFLPPWPVDRCAHGRGGSPLRNRAQPSAGYHPERRTRAGYRATSPERKPHHAHSYSKAYNPPKTSYEKKGASGKKPNTQRAFFAAPEITSLRSTPCSPSWLKIPFTMSRYIGNLADSHHAVPGTVSGLHRVSKFAQLRGR